MLVRERKHFAVEGKSYRKTKDTTKTKYSDLYNVYKERMTYRADVFSFA